MPTVLRKRCARSNTRLLAVLVAAASVSSARWRCCSASLARSHPLLLDGDAALPVGKTGERERDDEAGRKTAGEDVAPPCRAAPALGDEGLRLRGRLRRAARPRGDPALGFLQRRRAQ